MMDVSPRMLYTCNIQTQQGHWFSTTYRDHHAATRFAVDAMEGPYADRYAIVLDMTGTCLLTLGEPLLSETVDN